MRALLPLQLVVRKARGRGSDRASLKSERLESKVSAVCSLSDFRLARSDEVIE
jgi:hypothetical protein